MMFDAVILLLSAPRWSCVHALDWACHHRMHQLLTTFNCEDKHLLAVRVMCIF